ncbi:ABC transporter ATP-binding protein [Roseitranquillus sediminis]|uniref:ABC transporter ATP-binding protein n=1 Tax=Roseitranquillus sediminis TaxID=2809051 RepID=UPI001D0C023C|nr:ABC transporter ATP-binding protein [Roseitranquillus sediminis]MBM9594720.1 ABC transporter ATP-binding protein [Roseitranquillus sediminis]
MSHPVLALHGLSKQFTTRQDLAARLMTRFGMARKPPVVRAVDDVSLTIDEGEVLGLVGESGCGKSTLGRIVAGILEPSEGRIEFRGQNVSSLSGRERDNANLARQIIFQDPFSSLNPRQRVGSIVGEAPRKHGIIKGDFDAYVCEKLREAGLDPALRSRFPHQFSGGQRQRIGIARSLAVDPEFIVCDEAVAALDVSIQAQIINLFMDLQEQFNLTYLFISHDLGVVNHLADRVAIMYLGRIVEQGPKTELFARPNHPYTQALLAEIPRISVRHKSFHAIKGELPSPLAPPSGCHFHPRCPHAMDICARVAPKLQEVAPGQISACHLNDKS